MPDLVAAHVQRITHRYSIAFPEHPAREADPHYKDFHHYLTLHRATARCYVGERIGFDWCMDAQGLLVPAPEVGEQGGLELHHAFVEFSLQQGISLTALEQDFPGISDATDVGAWIETDVNFRFLCAAHHRGPSGAHNASHSDWTASLYVENLIRAAA